MMNQTANDHLVLKLVESDDADHLRETMYVFYDPVWETYGIRGGYHVTHRETGITSPVFFSFYCDKMADVITFLKVMTRQYHKLTVQLMKFTDLPVESDHITYDHLRRHDLNRHELVGFDFTGGQDITCILTDFLQVCTSVYNVY
jgi:hypothetical protein